MPGPTFTFAFVLATLFGAIFHLIVGGDARRLALFLLAGWVGFGLGNVLGDVFGLDFFPIGQLRIIPASLGALVALFTAYALTTNRMNRRVSR